uniref:HAD-IA family hydrolase n=1 Tax=Tessaracoccus coleopterorum TaxID=2714950 RepID=UPI0038CDBFB6
MPSVVVPRDTVKNGKPAPDSFLRAAELLGFAPARCLVVEDAPPGSPGRAPPAAPSSG